MNANKIVVFFLCCYIIKMTTEAQLKVWRKELIANYPNCEPYFIDLVLDVYKHNPEYIRKLPKRKIKAEPPPKTPVEIVGGVTVVKGDDERVKKWFKEPVYIPPPEEEVKTAIVEEVTN